MGGNSISYCIFKFNQLGRQSACEGRRCCCLSDRVTGLIGLRGWRGSLKRASVYMEESVQKRSSKREIYENYRSNWSEVDIHQIHHDVNAEEELYINWIRSKRARCGEYSCDSIENSFTEVPQLHTDYEELMTATSVASPSSNYSSAYNSTSYSGSANLHQVGGLHLNYRGNVEPVYNSRPSSSHNTSRPDSNSSSRCLLHQPEDYTVMDIESECFSPIIVDQRDDDRTHLQGQKGIQSWLHWNNTIENNNSDNSNTTGIDICKLCNRSVYVANRAVNGMAVQDVAAMFVKCTYCDRKCCRVRCIRTCEICGGSYCGGCSTVNYSSAFDRVLCLECHYSNR